MSWQRAQPVPSAKSTSQMRPGGRGKPERRARFAAVLGAADDDAVVVACRVRLDRELAARDVRNDWPVRQLHSRCRVTLRYHMPRRRDVSAAAYGRDSRTNPTRELACDQPFALSVMRLCDPNL